MIPTVQQALFVQAILGDLIGLGQALYVRYKGNRTAARAEISRIKDHWKDFDEENARIDAETAALKAQGK